MTLGNWTRKGRLIVCLALASSIGAAAWLTEPGSAAPAASCHGHVSVATTSHTVESNAIEYVFGCSTNIVGFSLFSTSKELSQYSPTAAVLKSDGGDATNDGNKEFNCGGDLPGLAQNCQGGLLKPTFVARGELGSTEARCSNEPTQWWLVTVDDAGQVAGPFNMGKRTRGCPKVEKATTHTRKGGKKH